MKLLREVNSYKKVATFCKVNKVKQVCLNLWHISLIFMLKVHKV